MTLAALFSFGLVPGVAVSGSFFVCPGYCSLGDIVWSSFVFVGCGREKVNCRLDRKLAFDLV